jgi:hypothetical protein
MKLVKNSKTYRSALHREIIFIPFDKPLMTYHSLFYLQKHAFIITQLCSNQSNTP